MNTPNNIKIPKNKLQNNFLLFLKLNQKIKLEIILKIITLKTVINNKFIIFSGKIKDNIPNKNVINEVNKITNELIIPPF